MGDQANRGCPDQRYLRCDRCRSTTGIPSPIRSLLNGELELRIEMQVQPNGLDRGTKPIQRVPMRDDQPRAAFARHLVPSSNVGEERTHLIVGRDANAPRMRSHAYST